MQRASCTGRHGSNLAAGQPQNRRDADDQASTRSSAAVSQEALRLQRQLYFEVGCLSP